jgi:hypothetical protein
VHRPQAMQSASVTFSAARGASPMGQARLHFPQLMHVSLFRTTFVKLSFWKMARAAPRGQR